MDSIKDLRAVSMLWFFRTAGALPINMFISDELVVLKRLVCAGMVRTTIKNNVPMVELRPAAKGV